MRKNFIKLHPSVIILFIFSIFFDFFNSLFFIYTVVFFHELAHYFTAKYFNVEADKIVIMPFGMNLRLKSECIKSPQQEFIISAAGPLANILMALILKVLNDLSMIPYDYFSFMLKVNLMIAFLNMLPILPLDGGRCLKSLLTLKIGLVRAFNLTYFTSKICIVILLFSGIVLLIFTKFNFSLLLISAFLIVNAVSERQIVRKIIIHDILYSGRKVSECGNKAELLVVNKHEFISKIIKLFNYNKYYIVGVVDDNMSVCAFLTETEIINGAVNFDSRIRIKELIE